MRRQAALTFVEVLVIIAIVGLLIALLLPMYRSAPEAARRNSCMNNMKNIALALDAYAQEHGTLPPAYTVDEQGNRLHSWRTLILPHMEQAALYQTIDLTKPWDDPVNAKAREAIIGTYQCPSAPESKGLTHYLAVVGSDCAFAGSEPRKLSEVKDGLANTIGIVEVKAERAVPWMSPEDIGPDEILDMLPHARMNHPGITLTAYLDGSTRSIDQAIDPDTLRALLTIAGDERVEF
jgi:type II secretory pathway pseudopilin PulG